MVPDFSFDTCISTDDPNQGCFRHKFQPSHPYEQSKSSEKTHDDGLPHMSTRMKNRSAIRHKYEPAAPSVPPHHPYLGSSRCVYMWWAVRFLEGGRIRSRSQRFVESRRMTFFSSNRVFDRKAEHSNPCMLNAPRCTLQEGDYSFECSYSEDSTSSGVKGSREPSAEDEFLFLGVYHDFGFLERSNNEDIR